MGSKENLRIVFMGTPDFAVPPLKALVRENYQVVGVYSQPPRPKNRGHALTKSPVHILAEDHNIPVFTPKNFKLEEDREFLKSLNPHVIVVVAYGLILPQAVLDIPSYGCVNIHGSILPRWRGAAPIQRAMLMGDEITGITLMRMDAGMDTGPMIATATYPLKNTDYMHTVYADLSHIGANLLIEHLMDYCEGKTALTHQPHEGVTLAPKLEKSESILNWHDAAPVLLRRIRTLNPWPGTTTLYKGGVLKIRDASLCFHVDVMANAIPGTLLPEGRVVCGHGTVLQLEILQKEGGKALPLKEFTNGFPLNAGEMLTSLA